MCKESLSDGDKESELNLNKNWPENLRDLLLELSSLFTIKPQTRAKYLIQKFGKLESFYHTLHVRTHG